MLALTIRGKAHKVHTKTINLTYQLQSEMINLNDQIDHILSQIFKIILSTLLRSMKHLVIICQ